MVFAHPAEAFANGTFNVCHEAQRARDYACSYKKALAKRGLGCEARPPRSATLSRPLQSRRLRPLVKKISDFGLPGLLREGIPSGASLALLLSVRGRRGAMAFTSPIHATVRAMTATLVRQSQMQRHNKG